MTTAGLSFDADINVRVLLLREDIFLLEKENVVRLEVVNEEQEDEVFCDEAILIAVARFWCGMMDGRR